MMCRDAKYCVSTAGVLRLAKEIRMLAQDDTHVIRMLAQDDMFVDLDQKSQEPFMELDWV